MLFYRTLGVLKEAVEWRQGLFSRGHVLAAFSRCCLGEPSKLHPCGQRNLVGNLGRMDVATGRTRTSYEWSQGAWHKREHTLIKFFLNDRLEPRNAINSLANIQPKAVFLLP